MSVHNEDIALIFGELAELPEAEDADLFRVRGLGRKLREMVAAGKDFTALPRYRLGVGCQNRGDRRHLPRRLPTRCSASCAGA